MKKDMSKRVFAIPDLVEEIYDFGDAGRDKHRQKMERVRGEVRLWFYNAAQELESSYYSSDYPHSSGNPFVRYVQECYSMEDKLDYVKYFMRCRCCSRHSHYKTEAKPDDPVPESDLVDKCYCKCRHYTRIFYRKILTVQDAPVQDAPVQDEDRWSPVEGVGGWG